MTILFCGGELDDFTTNGAVSANVTSSNYRTTYARMAVDVTGGSSAYAAASFTASSQFSVTGRFLAITAAASQPFLTVHDGSNQRLRLEMTGGFTNTIKLIKYDGSSSTTLATSTNTLTGSTLYRLDLIIDYQVAGRVRLYVDQMLYIDYSGDVTAASSTTLSQVRFSSPTSASSGRWSECIVCTQDSRTLSLKTLVPDAAGDTNTFTAGAYSDIDDITASDTDVAASATADQVLTVNCTGMPSGWANLTVTAVKAICSAARGATGPTKLAIGVRTSATNYFESGTTLDTGYTVYPQKVWETNPVTAAAWTTSEIDALQLAYKSEA